ncbi:DUF4270 domain-containing protein [Constantimarinum furrinae]|uniref:DUF4270 domain-containing protein n=1 Tax=Constantimarinum furrinae TaxID=2562285 RepID=A0A7G8PSG8_9FLAO|nr:DUF4270 domain-containing protein [Constantimarinum furrinae]QNJ97284.1 hypothetical protein ALE3EI_0707 [Constantimarinum furrinae]
MKFKNTLPVLLAILVAIIGFTSCEEDFNTIGSEIIGDQNINAQLDESGTVIAYSHKLTPVQTNGLPVYQLGIYNDPVFGKSTVNWLSQVTLESTDPNFGDSTELEEVFLYLPYFSTEEVVDEETTYSLDSIYGNTPITIEIYESNYFLRDFDPNTGLQETQKYYSNEGPTFENFLGELLLTIEDFKPSNEKIVVVEDDPTTTEVNEEEALIPGLRVELPVEFFKEKIIDMEGSSELLNNNNFREYFRGLYFKVSSPTNDGNLFFFDAANATITLNYTFEGEDPEDRIDAALTLLFNAISVNVYENNLPTSIVSDLLNVNETEGEETLYLRGGDGIITIVELFGEDTDNDGVPEELEDLREKEWLINEANLMFYVDQNRVVGGSNEPERIIIYDINNGTLLIDYTLDITSGEEPIDAFSQHFGRLERGSDSDGDFYKMRITNHISNLINKDSTNVRLGVMVSQNVKVPDFVDLKNPDLLNIEKVPATSVVSPQGTILHGNRSSNENKRLKLQIYYTEPN